MWPAADTTPLVVSHVTNEKILATLSGIDYWASMRHKSWCQMYASVIIFILLVWRLPYSLRPLICRGCYACEIDTCKWTTVYIFQDGKVLVPVLSTLRIKFILAFGLFARLFVSSVSFGYCLTNVSLFAVFPYESTLWNPLLGGRFRDPGFDPFLQDHWNRIDLAQFP